jgi:PAS domain S-box-containing protein
MIWEVDTRGTFRYISPTVQTILGYTPEEILGRSILDLVPEQEKKFALQGLQRMISREGSNTPLEVSALHRSGREVVLEIRPSSLAATGRELNVLRGVAVDITDRKNAHDALRSANRQLNLLTGITRHDILNKVSVILGFLKIAGTKTTDPEIAGYLNTINSATTAIRSQIEFTRVYEDLGTHKPQWYGLDDLLPRSSVPSSVVLHADLIGLRVFADPMLGKVFSNLLDNSIRHGQRVTEIRVSSVIAGENLVVVWEDNGIGIPADEKERLFERGFGKNTGFGMFLAREILALTGITITETGEPGKGARFEITVPNGAYQVSSAINES